MLESLRLDGKVALVTGAGRGIGRAISLALGEAGANLALTARTQSELDAVAAECCERFGVRALAVRADQRLIHEIEALVARTRQQLGAIDILVNNAGWLYDKPFLSMSEEETAALIDVNLMGPIRFLRAVAPTMIERRKGKIINVASIYSVIGASNVSVYCATKGALAQLTRALAIEWAPYNVYVNAICPGYVRTSANELALADERLRSAVIRRIPLRRVGESEEIGVLAVFLASSASGFVTGALYLMDGGETAK